MVPGGDGEKKVFEYEEHEVKQKLTKEEAVVPVKVRFRSSKFQIYRMILNQISSG